MKAFFYYILFLAFFGSCKNENLPDSFDFGVENEFSMFSEYHAENGNLSFMISEISDSRCPIDVICVWAGMAEVKIEILKPENATIKVNTLNNQVDSIAGYSFELRQVSPTPVSSQTIENKDYRIILIIEKLKNQ
jgi:hypothetical protein